MFHAGLGVDASGTVGSHLIRWSARSRRQDRNPADTHAEDECRTGIGLEADRADGMFYPYSSLVSSR